MDWLKLMPDRNQFIPMDLVVKKTVEMRMWKSERDWLNKVCKENSTDSNRIIIALIRKAMREEQNGLS